MYKIFLFLSLLLSAQILQEVVVKPGDTIWGIAQQYLKDPTKWPEILKANNLQIDPMAALPGMVLKIPVLLIKEELRAARVIYLLNDVRYRRKGETDWQKAYLNLQLYNEDGVRTMLASKADIEYPSGQVINVAENSLVVVRPMMAKEEATLFEGDLRASKARVILRSGAIVEPKGRADYRAKIREDLSELVWVYEGAVDVTHRGVTVEVKKGFATLIKSPDLPPSTPIPIPDVPAIALNPEKLDFKSEKVVATNIKGEVEVELKLPEKGVKIAKDFIKGFKIQISDDKSFSNIIFEKFYKADERFRIKDLDLKDGAYFYRVSYVDALGIEGRYSSPIEFVIDKTAPMLEIIHPPSNYETSEAEIIITGKTEPDAGIFIQNISVQNQDGKFKLKYVLEPGANNILIRAYDKFDNVTEKNLRVIFSPTEKSLQDYYKLKRRKETESTIISIVVGLLSIGVMIIVLTR
ncbi:MAG: LysM peptidoglycan-binding domain-containing protein [bacterium]|nr:LysM peptidoglycan-binding domain-containing protein [bacterium]